MVDIAPFRGLRYDPGVAGSPAATSAPAYDDLERLAYAAHRTANPYTVLELLSPADGYGAAAAAYERWLRTGVLTFDERPGLYIYEEHELRRGVPAVQRGILGAVHVQGRDGGRVLPHEDVEGERVEERVRRLHVVPIEVSPVFALYRGGPAALRQLLHRPPRTRPVVAMTDDAGIDHRVWAITDAATIDGVTRALAGRDVLVADGHHRYASARALAEQQGARSVGALNQPWERTLMYLVDAASDGPQVLGIHRLVRGVPRDMRQRLEADFTLEDTGPVTGGLVVLRERLDRVDGVGFGMAYGGRALFCVARDPAAVVARMPDDRPPSWRRLDAAVLHHYVLPLLNAGDADVTYSPDAAALAAEAAAPDTAVFLLRPAPLDVVFALAVSGERLPPKSTWFRPKPRAGLLMRSLTPDTPG